MLNINNHYSFSLYANSVLGNSYRNAKLISVMDYEMALKFSNVELIHRQVYPYLPPGAPSDNTKYTYYLFVIGDKRVVIAEEWIISNSIVLSTDKSTVITLHNVTSGQVAVVSDQLRLLGINFDIL